MRLTSRSNIDQTKIDETNIKNKTDEAKIYESNTNKDINIPTEPVFLPSSLALLCLYPLPLPQRQSP